MLAFLQFMSKFANSGHVSPTKLNQTKAFEEGAVGARIAGWPSIHR